MASSEKPKYAMPTGRVRYDDSSVSGKTYVESDTQRTRVTTADSPFGLEFMKSLFSVRRKDAQLEKMPMETTTQHAFVPVTDESGKRFNAHFFDVKYHAQGAMPVVAKGDGTVEKGSMPFMMAPGMKREPGEFAVYSVPKENMSQPRSSFSYFTEIEEPGKTKP